MGTSLCQVATAVDTYNWDTVFVIPVSDVNAAIVSNKSSPLSFSYCQNGISISGTFCDWQVVQGGDGSNIRILLPFTNASATLSSTGAPTDIGSGSTIIEVKLQYLSIVEGGSAKSQHLKVITVGTPSNPPASLVTSNLPECADALVSAVFEQSLLEWCIANLEDFVHTFAVVDLNTDVDQGAWGFVAPNYLSYAYADGSSLATSVLAVLCMTGNRTGEALANQVDPSAIPTNAESCFLISQSRVMDSLVRPALCAVYQTLVAADLALSQDGTTLTLNHGVTVTLPSVEHDGLSYTPNLTFLQIIAMGSVLQMTSITETPVGLGFTATANVVNTYTLALTTSAVGQQSVGFQKVGDPVETNTVADPSGLSTVQEVIAIAGTIVLLVLTVITGGAALVMVGVIVGLVTGASQIIPAVIESAGKNVSPGLDLLLANTVAPIRWANASEFTLTSVALNVSLQLGGSPNFSHNADASASSAGAPQ